MREIIHFPYRVQILINDDAVTQIFPWLNDSHGPGRHAAHGPGRHAAAYSFGRKYWVWEWDTLGDFFMEFKFRNAAHAVEFKLRFG